MRHHVRWETAFQLCIPLWLLCQADVICINKLPRPSYRKVIGVEVKPCSLTHLFTPRDTNVTCHILWVCLSELLFALAELCRRQNHTDKSTPHVAQTEILSIFCCHYPSPNQQCSTKGSIAVNNCCRNLYKDVRRIVISIILVLLGPDFLKVLGKSFPKIFVIIS